MLPPGVTKLMVRSLDWVSQRVHRADTRPAHQLTGRRGEDDAYFHLRKLGYAIVARNYRSPRWPGEIDLIGWEDDILCFIEVKTRKTRDVKAAVAAVDYHKRREIAQVARDYLRLAPPLCQWRFDVVSVYYDGRNPHPQIEVFRNASLGA
jgi:putative endonuclease